jgi:hypothetical protein
MIIKEDLQNLRRIIMEWLDGGNIENKTDIYNLKELIEVDFITYKYYTLSGQNLIAAVDDILHSLSNIYAYGDGINWINTGEQLDIRVVYKYPNGTKEIMHIILERR